MIRLAIAMITGIIVAGVPLSVVVSGFYFLDFSAEQRKTQASLRIVERTIEIDRKNQGSYPLTLDALLPAGLDDRDGWGNRWIYTLPAGEPLIESLGRDAKRGGFEQDADLSNRNPRPDAARLAPWKRLIHPQAMVATLIALMSGLVAGVAVFVELNKAPAQRKSWGQILGSLFVTAGLAALGAAFIAIAHVPSGH